MSTSTERPPIVVNPENLWRLESPGAHGWERSVEPGAANKYFIVSVDNHLGPPVTLFHERIEKQFVDRLPRMEKRDGKRYLISEGRRPRQLLEEHLEGEDEFRHKAGSGGMALMVGGGSTIHERSLDQDRDGVDCELLFPNGPGLSMFASHDHEFVQAQCRVWNDWAWEVCSPYKARCNPAAAIGTADLESAIAEVERVAKLGYRVVMLPCKPVYGPANTRQVNYNLPHFDPLWAVIQDADLTITFHVSTGMDPRIVTGPGGAIVNYAVGSLAPTIEPVVNLCASGVLDRFPKLRFSTIEANAGWVPWLLDTMDESARKHHMWVRPKLQMLPSEYYRRNGGASFCDDRSATLLVEPYGLEENFMFANDYPHHEGCWPHSAPTIERLMGHLKEETRKKLLGYNAARFFRFDIPEKYRS